MKPTTVLLADDEETLRGNLAQVLEEEEGFRVISCGDGAEALRNLKAHGVDAIITDLRMPGVTGMDLIDEAVKLAPDAVIIVITAFGEVETAVEAMKKGVRDYICKPLILDEVVFKLKRLLAQDGLARENRILREQIQRTHDAAVIVGNSAAINSMKETIARVCQTMSNVLISGESGTGKEVIARAIHYSGLTHDKPFVPVNCGGLADTLIESELFGHRKGSFTGAQSSREGYFEAADGGTLFLDEIGNLPYQSQAVLLRVIEQRAVTRVGESRARRVQIRVIAATNRDLRAAVEKGEFREDLFYRLNVVHVDVAPLRERREDIEPLTAHFLKKYNEELNTSCPGFTPRAVEAMMTYGWRGNIRELDNVVERALIFADGRRIDIADLPPPLGPDGDAGPSAGSLRAATREFERQHIARVLCRHGGNKVEAAQVLGIGLSSLYRKLDELDMHALATSETTAH